MDNTKDVLSVVLEIDDAKATVKLDNFGQKIKIVSDDINKTGGDKTFAGKLVTDFDALSKKAEQTHQSFQNISKVRLDSGQIGVLSREIITAQERSRILVADIVNIRRELANPNRRSSIAFLTSELKGAENELDSLTRKLKTLPSSSAAGQKADKFHQLRGYGALFREFAPEGVNESVINAGTAVAPLLGIGTATLATFSAIAVAGYAIVKATQNIREEAEKRLKTEEMISAAMSRQALSQKEAIANLQQLRKEADFDRGFSNTLQTSTIEELQRRRKTYEDLSKLIPARETAVENGQLVSKPNERYEKNNQQILAFDAQIAALQQKNTRTADDNFRNRFENEQKLRAQAAEIAAEVEKKRREELEKSKIKIKDLEKAYLSVYDSIAAKAGQNNPFVSLFTEADKSLRILRENTKGLSKDLISTFEMMQAKQNEIALFSARLDNRLNVFDLQESANNFRNAQDPETDKRRRDEIIKDDIRRGNFFNNGAFGTYGSYLANGAGGADKLTEQQKRDIYETSLLKYSDGGLNQSSLISRLASERRSNPDQSLQERLQKQFDIVDKLRGTAKNDDERSIADRRIIALTQGLNPNDLTRSEREKAAVARENEAVRVSSNEKDAKAEREKDRKIQQQIADNTKRFLDLAEKEGLKAVLEIVDKTGGGVNLSSSPTNSDTQGYYDK